MQAKKFQDNFRRKTSIILTLIAQGKAYDSYTKFSIGLQSSMKVSHVSSRLYHTPKHIICLNDAC